MGGVGLNFFSQLSDEYPEVLRMGGGVDAPNGGQDRVVRQYAIRMARKIRQQLKLLRCQADFLGAALHAASIEVNRQIPMLKFAGFGRMRIKSPAQRHADAG